MPSSSSYYYSSGSNAPSSYYYPSTYRSSYGPSARVGPPGMMLPIPICPDNMFSLPKVVRVPGGPRDQCCYPPPRPPWCGPPGPYGPPPPFGPPPPPPCFPPPLLPPPCYPPPPPPPICGPKQIFRVPKGYPPPCFSCGDGGQPQYNNCNFYTTSDPYGPAFPSRPPFPGSSYGGGGCPAPSLSLINPSQILRNAMRGKNLGDDQSLSSLDNFYFQDLDHLANDSTS